MKKRNRQGFRLTEPLFPEDQARAKRAKEFDSPEFRKAYLDHIRSPYWRNLSRTVREKARGKCTQCKLPAKRLEVHHLHYETFGYESECDVVALCVGCHNQAHYERNRRAVQNYFAAGEDARREAAKETFLSKYLSSYGDDYKLAYYCDPEPCDEKFEEWYAKKREEDLYD